VPVLNQTDVAYPQAEGADWHRLKQPLLMIQYDNVNQSFDQAPIVYPPAMKSAEVQRLR
jgi:hypothetical protein